LDQPNKSINMKIVNEISFPKTDKWGPVATQGFNTALDIFPIDRIAFPNKVPIANPLKCF
jgi:hypothetical protein